MTVKLMKEKLPTLADSEDDIDVVNSIARVLLLPSVGVVAVAPSTFRTVVPKGTSMVTVKGPCSQQADVRCLIRLLFSQGL